jgi:HD-GYP domain-containing protein (c-di-GMP phosphodiesterase class II)
MKKNFEVTLKQMILIIHRAINSVDIRLYNHGEKVAYIMMNLLKVDGGYSEEEMLDICAISVFHDIGAYKVAERDKLAQIDTVSPFDHAVYGALFIKYFSPLSRLYKIVLTHHFTYKYYKNNNIEVISEEGLLLNFADYIDRLFTNKKSLTREDIEATSHFYLREHINLFLRADEKYNLISKLIDGSYEQELHSFFESKILKREEVIAYGKMLAYSIDFRSEATVKHTILVEAISYQIGKLAGLGEETLTQIKVASVLHDVGKIAIPVEILEKPGKLTQEEFEIMKKHSIIGYNILSDLNINDIRDIGTLHHEKIDGTGYPFGLKGEELTLEARIVAIGDIISALFGARSYKEAFNKEKIVKILEAMMRSNKIDSEIGVLFINNYDFIINEALEESNELMEIYMNLNIEYNTLLKQFL